MVIRDAIAHGFAKIRQKAIADLPAAYDLSGNNWQIGQHVIATTFQDLFPETFSPVNASLLPAVGLQVAECFSRLGTNTFQHRPDPGIPIAGEMGFDNVIKHKPLPVNTDSCNMGARKE